MISSNSASVSFLMYTIFVISLVLKYIDLISNYLYFLVSIDIIKIISYVVFSFFYLEGGYIFTVIFAAFN